MNIGDSKNMKARLSVIPIAAGVGAEIVGIDLSAKLDDTTFAEVRDAFHTHSVILIRGQRITEEQHIDFSRRFGNLVVHPLKYQLHPQHPEIAVVSNIIENGRHIGAYDAGRFWHSDLSFTPTPSMGSILCAVEVPHDENGDPLGDTVFANVTAAYEALPEDVKKRLEGLKARYSLEHRNEISKQGGDARAEDYVEATTGAIHPVVRTHPVTGRKSIYANPGHTAAILGMPRAESEKLLHLLYAQCVRPEFLYRHRWKANDLIMWDNAAVQHLAIMDYKLPQRRRMQRTTIEGDVPF